MARQNDILYLFDFLQGIIIPVEVGRCVVIRLAGPCIPLGGTGEEEHGEHQDKGVYQQILQE